jgi:hypothetical protein
VSSKFFPSAAYIRVADITCLCLTHHSHQHAICCYFSWIVRPEFQGTPLWVHGVVKWHFWLWAVKWPIFTQKIFIHRPHLE